MEYTKGEWEVYTGHDAGMRPLILVPDKPNRPNKVIARLIDGKDNELLANARLIAAAPKMYEALKDMQEYVLVNVVVENDAIRHRLNQARIMVADIISEVESK